MKAVHFGAGNIGRGFIGAVLQDAGFHVTFADVNQEILDALNNSGEYQLTELDSLASTKTYSNFSALHSVNQRDELVAVVASADLVTASVGAGILPRIASTIQEGIQARSAQNPLVVMACENAVNATDILENAIGIQDSSKVVYANTAVDRIVPMQNQGTEPNVSVEPFCEWVIDNTNLEGLDLEIPGAKFVPDLMPFIERKLYTVNTGHLTVAYLGQLAGHPSISIALSDPDVLLYTQRVLDETSMALVHKHGFDESEHALYVKKTLSRLANPAIDDSVKRVGRQPLRKLSRHERLIGPAAYLSEMGRIPVSLLGVVGAALRFVSESDPEVAQMQKLLSVKNAAEFVTQVTGIGQGHSLFEALVSVVAHHDEAFALPEMAN
jgi:mannitol-1-phosphate 5-dehydrogenase